MFSQIVFLAVGCMVPPHASPVSQGSQMQFVLSSQSPTRHLLQRPKTLFGPVAVAGENQSNSLNVVQQVSGCQISGAMVPSGISDVDLHDTGVSNTSASSGQQGQHALPRVIPDLEHDDVLPKIPSSIDGGVGGRYSVSVAQMRTPGRARSLFNKAIKAVSRKRSAEAFEFLEQALSVHSSFAEAMALRGILKMNEGQQDDARADLERAVQLDAGNSPALITLGEIYNLHARWDDAVRVLERGLSFNPRSWQGHYELGLALLVKNDYVPALMHMTRAEEIRPDYGPLRLLRADALLALRRYSETKSELEAYLQREPDGVYAFETRLALDRMSALTTQARK